MNVHSALTLPHAASAWSTCSQFDRAALGDCCEQLGEKPFARPSCSAGSTSAASATSAPMTDLAKSLRDKLAGGADDRGAAVVSEQVAADGTVKWLFDVGAGNAVETVFIPEADRGTLCISSQAGCAVDCRSARPATRASAATSTTAEIVAQLWHAEFDAAPPRSALAAGERADHQRRDDGHGRAAAELRQRSCRRCA